MNTRSFRQRALFVAGVALMAATARGDIPTAFTFQGRLSDGGGPADGTFDFIFDLYSQPSGGIAGPTTSIPGVAVSNGYFTVFLDYGDNVFTGRTWFVETRARPQGGGAYETLSPRQPIMPTPYAIYAATIKDGAVDGAKLAENAVTADKIQNGSITLADIGQNGAANGQVMKWIGSAWAAADDLSGSGGATDHGALTGLADDDHPHYLRSNASDVYNEAGTSLSLRFEGNTDPSLMYLSGTLDAVGIGTGSPAGKLQIVGDEVRIGNGGSVGHASSDGDLYVEDTLEVDGFTRIDDDLTMGDGTDGFDDGAEALRISAQAADWYIGVRNEASAADSDIYIGSAFGDESTFCIEPDGSVGIGTASPGSHGLSVVHSASAFGGAAGLFETTHPAGVALAAQADSSGATMMLGQTGSGDFLQCYSTLVDYPIRLKKDGTVECKVLSITGGSDVAEPFPTAGGKGFAPGTVLVIDAETPGALRCAEEPYDRRVAGVVSGAGGVNPGIMLRQNDSVADGDCPVALNGRAYAWADAAYGAIQPGDLLTTSATPGHAMKVTDQGRAPGAVLGKAMSPLHSGRGLVLVLVSLH